MDFIEKFSSKLKRSSAERVHCNQQAEKPHREQILSEATRNDHRSSCDLIWGLRDIYHYMGGNILHNESTLRTVYSRDQGLFLEQGGQLLPFINSDKHPKEEFIGNWFPCNFQIERLTFDVLETALGQVLYNYRQPKEAILYSISYNAGVV